MTEDAAPPPDPAEPVPERVHVTARPAAQRPAVAPVIYLAGAIVLAAALLFLWRYPSGSRRLAEDTDRLQALSGEVANLSDQVKELASRTGPDLGPLEARVAALEGRAPPELGPLAARVAALEGRRPSDLGPLEARVARLEARPAAPPPADLSGLTARLDALARDDGAAGAKRDAALAALGTRLDAAAGDLGSRLAALDAHVTQLERAQGAMTGLAARAERIARVQAATAALDAGQPLGPLPDAPPALARFAAAAPPTPAFLRLGFAGAADAARRASQPAATGDRGFLGRAWVIAQDAVTVRQGDRVMLGDPVAGVLAHAQELLDAGDLPGCLRALDGLAGPAAAAMADWRGQAEALLDARAALAAMAGASTTSPASGG